MEKQAHGSELPSPFHSSPQECQSSKVTGPNPLGQHIPNTNAASERFGKKRNVTLVTPSIAYAIAPIPLKMREFQEEKPHFAWSRR
jgi:hypothetical protein